ncbi:receptor expression-enhancing protein 5-like isoform X1 [Hylaeus anthracinus]|uniref:receptor expression-enhancing protein 5-like isoform X1 n=1 Tax=Hylaeus volcanicus TaxID=313075 RepID=UPI0023B783C5|nr:receptor expression-enhancing protein 5-like isoform X1 [Hylaeus volcanicus]XP_054000699.1 receptor expression-enhancing protein 5-like isoform X1 [Hylaeus anthracinus]
MARITAVKESLEKALRDENKFWTKYFAKIEKQTGVDRIFVFLGSVVVLALYLVFGIGQQLVCNIFGFVYPAYCSMKALESPKKEDDTKWLTYWVVFAVFTIVEFFSDYILCWFPVYWLFKCLFYMWLMAPMENNGAIILYRRVIRPNFLRYHHKVDELISNAQDAAVKAAANALLTEKQE